MDNEIKKVLFIINKFSGTGYQAKLEGRILQACQDNNTECSIEFTEGRGHATELARKGVTEKYDGVVAVGGDGTLNEVGQGLVYTSMPMGIIPGGSGNGLARHLGIPIDVQKAVDCLFKSSPQKIDTLSVNGRLSLNVSGIGFDGHVANQFAKSVKRGLGSYARITIEEYRKFKTFEAHLTLNDKSITRKAFIIAVANSSQYGNNARIAPLASVCDRKMHITITTKVPPYRLDFAYSLFTGGIDQSKYCETLITNHVVIQTEQPVSFHIDGEPSGTDNTFDIKINPLSLHLLVPSHGKNI